jgi:ATPase complex subunit ATP10
VAISCKEFGARLLPSWINPFEIALRGIDEDDAEKYEVVRITLNEGRMAKLLSPFIVSGTKKNVPPAEHSSTLLYYGDAEAMRDVLRMHNIYTAYVFLLDGMGRVRWAGSGEGSETEVQTMIDIARDIVGPSSSMRVVPRQKQTSTPRLGKKIPRN